MYETMRLSRDAVDGITRFGARASWPAGITVYERGASADGVFVVLSGQIVLRSRVKAGRGYIPLIVTPGGTFGGEGLAAASRPPGHYVTEARADDATETLHLSGVRFRAMAREEPTLALALNAQLMAEQATLLDKLRELATLSVEQRLVMSVVRMARQHTSVDTEGRLALDAPRYRLLCELVGATRESVSMVLNRLIAHGAAERREGCVLVDADAMTALQPLAPH
jgi:CRP/FNR family transcriptional regulator, cyclic AMP receptor protein